ncbi:hypothetical protein [Stappia sp. 28M-7]|uniref:hypothetical protein n=1 Tax=Stappia sp. 28M-7 TaxID=2762596 RepID=UPI00163D07D0|nr:hypothetical protein [Stappia sp. 28M-7]MBC2860046.1 hypothetical protein [Stappia sp. 28M-7]
MKTSINAVHSPADLCAHIAARLHDKDLLVVGVCGMAGSGKSTLCDQIAEIASFDAVRLDCDQFSSHSLAERQTLIEEATKSGNPQQIEAIENPLNWYAFGDILSALDDLKSNRIHTYNRAWNRQTGELNGQYCLTVPTGRPAVVLCDCIYLLHPAVRNELDLMVLVEAPEDILVERGRRRSRGDLSRANHMESLRRKYSVPYFKTFGGTADIVYRVLI